MPIHTSKMVHEYPYGHPRRVGERFEVDAGDVGLMLTLGRIEPEPDQPTVPEGTMRDMSPAAPAEYQTRAMKSEPRMKRPYNRKAAA